MADPLPVDPPPTPGPSGIDEAVNELRAIVGLLQQQQQQGSQRQPTDPATQELRTLVTLMQAQHQVTTKTYQVLSGGSGGLTTPAKERGGFPEHWQGVEGQARRSAAGFKTFGQTAEAIAHPIRESQLGRWLSDQWEGAKSYAGSAADVSKRVGKSVLGEEGSYLAEGFLKITKNIISGLGVLAETAGRVVVGFVKVRDATDRWTGDALKAASKFAEVSGSMAGVMAEREIREMARGVKRGEATADTTRMLVASEDARKKEEDKIGILFDNLSNMGLTILNGIMAKIIAPFGSLAEEMEKVRKEFADMIGFAAVEAEPTGLAATMEEVRRIDDRNHARAAELMDAARRAGGVPGGVVAPGGAAPLGRLPGPLRRP